MVVHEEQTQRRAGTADVGRCIDDGDYRQVLPHGIHLRGEAPPSANP
jgi:hypothetical protein